MTLLLCLRLTNLNGSPNLDLLVCATLLIKSFSRVIVDIMKHILPRIVFEPQRAFVPGRLIQDNIYISHEAYHYLKNKRNGNRVGVAVKMDMKKAYDRI